MLLAGLVRSSGSGLLVAALVGGFSLLSLSGCGVPGEFQWGSSGISSLQPRLSTMDPAGGAVSGGTLVTLKGENLAAVKQILFGATPCDLQSASGAELRCVTRATPASWAPVVAIAPGGVASLPGLGYGFGALAVGQPDLKDVGLDLTRGLAYPKALATDGTRLVIADTTGQRVLLWNNIPADANTPADVVLGQPDLRHLGTNSPYTQTSILGVASPSGVCLSGNRLAVTDTNNNRVLIWDQLPTVNRTAPTWVLGQSDFNSGSANRGGAATAATLSGALGIWCDATRIAVADASNNRVLLWTQPITSNGQPADLVLGQADFTSVAVNRGAGATPALNTLRFPSGVFFDGTYLSVADTNNNRVLLFTGFPSADGLAATRVLGQVNATTGSALTSAQRMRAPVSVYSEGSRLYVADTSNHRVMVWDLTAAGGPTAWAHGRAADLFLGQPSGAVGVINNGGLSGSSLYSPMGIVTAGSSLIIADQGNSRVLRWMSAPLVNGEAATGVLGQASLNRRDVLWGAHSSTSVYDVSDLHVVNGKLHAMETGSVRTVVYNSLPTTAFPVVDGFFGQADLTSGERGGAAGVPTPFSLEKAMGLFVSEIDDATYVADYSNHRVLIWNSPPTTGLVPPDQILGQATGVTKVADSAATGLNAPTAICRVGSRLYVADSLNHRVLGWNSLPMGNAPAADFVLGQAGFGAGNNLVNRGGTPAANTLSSPQGLYCDANRLIVADANNHRVLVWNTLPTATGVPADVVIGQPDMSTNAAGTTAALLNTPRRITLDGNTLYVVDTGNNRLLRWRDLPTTNGAAAGAVFGQPDFFSGADNAGLSKEMTDLHALRSPAGVRALDAERLVIADQNNKRLLIIPKF